MYKISSKFLQLPILFLFLPAFSFKLSLLGGVYNYCYVVLYACLLICLITNLRSFTNRVNSIIIHTPLKYYFLFLLVISISSICISLTNINILLITIRSIILKFCLCIIPIIIYFVYIVDKYISFEKFFKYFIFLIWTTFVLGIISYVGQLFDIGFINTFFQFFANARLFDINGYYALSATDMNNYNAFGLPRLSCLYQEPSQHAQFIFLFLPFIYNFGLSKYRIVNNIFLNNLILKTLIPLAWINLIMTASPIYLVLCSILSLIIFKDKVIKFCIKNYKVISFISILLLIIVLFIIEARLLTLEQTYLSRIINIFTEVRSFDDLIEIDPSLSTRIVNYVNLFNIFIKHPVFGVGLGNLSNELLNQYVKSTVPLTIENVQQWTLAIYNKSTIFHNGSIIYDTLAQFGLVGISILYYFLFKLYSTLKKYIRLISDDQFLNTIGISLYGSFISIFIISFYASGITMLWFNILIFMAVSAIYKYKNILMKNFYIEKSHIGEL